MTDKQRFLILALLILLAGFGLRLALHDYHGLEGDDAFSLALSRYDTVTLLDGLARLELDIHPPLHFLALKGWTSIAGESLLSLRLMNILMDVLTGALLMRLSGRLWSRRTVLVIGLMWLCNPLLIYATYLIRMYTLMTLLTTAGLAFLVEAGTGRRRALWYVLAAVCGLGAAYTHVIGGLVLVILALACAADWATLRWYPIGPRPTWRDLLAGVTAFVVAGILYLPYVLSVWALYQSGRPLGAEIAEASFNDPISAVGAITLSLLTHRSLMSDWRTVIILTIPLFGTYFLVRHRQMRIVAPAVLVWGSLVGMTGLAMLAGMYKARYLAPFVPPFLTLLVGTLFLGILMRNKKRWISRINIIVSITMALMLVLTSFFSVLIDLKRDYRDDWVAAADFVRQHERPGDTIIVIPDWGQEAFKYHYSGAAPVTGVFPQVGADVNVAPVLSDLQAGHDHVWLVRYQPEVSDPQNRALSWFEERAALITAVFPTGMHIKYYDFAPRMVELPADVRPLDAQFGDDLALRGVYLPVSRGSAGDSRLHPPANWVQVWLYWEALRPQLEVTPRVRFTDAIGQVYGAALERANDVPHLFPVSGWKTGEIWQVAYDLNLNPDMPVGTYNIEVMVLDSAGNPLPATGADAGDFWVIAGQFVVE